MEQKWPDPGQGDRAVIIDGSEVAAGILAEAVDPVGEGRAVPVAMYVSGRFIESKLTGIDAAAKADLGGGFQCSRGR